MAESTIKMPDNVPCPYVYAKGRKCKGHIVRVEAFKADLRWALGDDGAWSFNIGQPRSHYHLYCSEKDNHAGYGKPDSEAMKFYYDKLPQAVPGDNIRPRARRGQPEQRRGEVMTNFAGMPENWACVDCGMNTAPGAPTGPEIKAAHDTRAIRAGRLCNDAHRRRQRSVLRAEESLAARWHEA